MTMMEKMESLFAQVSPAVDFCSMRVVRQRDEMLTVRQDIPEPAYRSEDVGVMIAVAHGGGWGYGATCDLTLTGLQRAVGAATRFAKLSAGRSVCDFSQIDWPCPTGEYLGPADEPWEACSLGHKFDVLAKASRRLKIEERIVDWQAGLWHTDCESLYLTTAGARVYQKFSLMAPELSATANHKAETQTRTMGSVRGCCSQGGMEALEACDFTRASRVIPQEAIQLLEAENCPTGTMDAILASDQMMLQIHESIGHPLEIDRILGDERNYAGTSFVTPDMIGSYQYGSELLNVTFDPTMAREFASYGYDDDGLAATKEFIIRDGILERGLGGCVSQARSGLPGVANTRASSWNRPPMDRMANLNVEPGESTLAEMIGSVERGVLMRTNRSWSIDDSRNKFQFGCEFAELIEDGVLKGVVKNPNYRGVSETFWRSLAGVGKVETRGVFGTPFCGKGEPNQAIRVGHASPACLFQSIDVFGGA